MSTALTGEEPADTSPAPGSPTPSLARNAGARLVADLSTFVFGAIGAVVTARWLGPSGRGIVTALGFISMIFIAVASMGLTDAAVVMVGRRNISMSAALRTNLGFAGLSGAAAAMACLTLAALQVGPDSFEIWLAVGMAALAVPIGTIQGILAGGLMMTERIVDASLVIALASLSTLFATCILVIPLSLGILGAVGAMTIGAVTGVVLATALLRRDFKIVPSWDFEYLRPAVKYGAKVQASHLVTLMAGRLDLLIAFSLLGEASAGQYSIALTVASVVVLGPFALAYATFPRLAYVEAAEVTGLTLLIWRRAVMAALLVALTLALICPFGIPLLFGDRFTPAVTPSLILIAGALFTSGQWTLARAVASRGSPELLLHSFGLSLILMVGLDFALMPPFDLVGAAVASAVSSLAGLMLCIRHYHRNEALPLSALRPRASDLPELIADSSRLFRTLPSALRPGPPSN